MSRTTLPKRVKSKNDIPARLAAVRQLLADVSLTSLIIADPVDVEYVTGFRSSNSTLLITRRSYKLFSDFRYKEAAESFCRQHPLWKFILVERQIEREIACFIPEGSVVGFQSDFVTIDGFKRLKQVIKKTRFKGCGAAFAECIIPKEPAEIAFMEQAAAIGDRALEKLRGFIRPGVTEVAVARELEQYCRELGSEKPSFDTIVLFGARSALPHGVPGSTTCRRGDFILIDFGCTVGGYASDMTRTMVLGKASARQKQLYSIVADAQAAARAAACAGLTAQQLDASARTPITNAGFGEFFGHALGHGLGLRIHEVPRVSSYSTMVLPNSAVVTIEPGIYIPGFGGIRIEDMVVLTGDTARLLTHTTRELIVL